MGNIIALQLLCTLWEQTSDGLAILCLVMTMKFFFLDCQRSKGLQNAFSLLTPSMLKILEYIQISMCEMQYLVFINTLSSLYFSINAISSLHKKFSTSYSKQWSYKEICPSITINNGKKMVYSFTCDESS